MAVGDFFNRATIEKSLPDLHLYMLKKAGDVEYRVGISKRGNLKYTLPDNRAQVYSIDKNGIPKQMFKAFSEFAGYINAALSTEKNAVGSLYPISVNADTLAPLFTLIRKECKSARKELSDCEFVLQSKKRYGLFDKSSKREIPINKEYALVIRTFILGCRNGSSKEELRAVIFETVDKLVRKMDSVRTAIRDVGKKIIEEKGDIVRISIAERKNPLEIAVQYKFCASSPNIRNGVHDSSSVCLKTLQAINVQAYKKELEKDILDYIEKDIGNYNEDVFLSAFSDIWPHIISEVNNIANKKKILGNFYSDKVGEITGIRFNEGLVLTNKCQVDKHTFVNIFYDVDELDTGLCVYTRKDNVSSAKQHIAHLFDECFRAQYTSRVSQIKDINVKNLPEKFSKLVEKTNEYDRVCALKTNDILIAQQNRKGQERVTLTYTPSKHEWLYKRGTLFSSTLIKNSVKIEASEQYLSRAAVVNNVKNQRAVAEMEKWLHGDGSVYTIKYIYGPGCVIGKTKLQISGDGVSFDYTWSTSPASESIVEWRKNKEKNIKEITKRFADEKKAAVKRYYDKYGSYIESYLDRDIMKFVASNERYITQNATTNYLRGLHGNFGGSITDVGTRGKYNHISSDEVDERIAAIIKGGLLRKQICKGTYGDFYILKVTQSGEDFLKSVPKEYKAKNVIISLNEDAVVSDVAADTAFSYIREKDKLAIKDYMSVLSLVGAKGFLCAHWDECVSFFRTAPEEIKDYLVMMKTLETDKTLKKLYVSATKKVTKEA